MEENNKIVLGLEIGLTRGSLSILKNGREIDFVEGVSAVAKSEDILQLLGEVLTKNKIKKQNIEIIAVSAQYGSLTGNRIGLAISKGLADAFDAKITNVALLEVLADINKIGERILSAILVNVNTVVFEEFTRSVDGSLYSEVPPNSLLFDEFVKQILEIKREQVSFVLTENLYRLIAKVQDLKEFFDNAELLVVDDRLAKLIGLAGNNIASDNQSGNY